MTEELKAVEGSNDNTTSLEGDVVKKTYTEEEYQQYADRRVSQALKTQAEKFERKMAEAEKLRSMDEKQRQEYEFTQRLKELENKEKEFAITQNKLEASKVMANRGLPIEFVDYIVAENAEDMMENITVFERAFKAAVADEVAKKIASPTPKSSTATQTGITKEEFRKLNLQQQAEIYRTNPELYRSLTN